MLTLADLSASSNDTDPSVIIMYGYDSGGRVTSVTNGYGEVTNYGLDGEGKLLTQSNSNGTSATYTYNPQRGWPTHIAWLWARKFPRLRSTHRSVCGW